MRVLQARKKAEPPRVRGRRCGGGTHRRAGAWQRGWPHLGAAGVISSTSTPREEPRRRSDRPDVFRRDRPPCRGLARRGSAHPSGSNRFGADPGFLRHKAGPEDAGRFIRAVEGTNRRGKRLCPASCVKIGVAIANDRDVDAAPLMRRAEDALTEAKRPPFPLPDFSRDIAVEARSASRTRYTVINIVAALNEPARCTRCPSAGGRPPRAHASRFDEVPGA